VFQTHLSENHNYLFLKQYGLIGFPLTHSFARSYFAEKFKREQVSNCTYENFPLASIEEFPSLLKSQPGLEGLNVTIPYKESVIGYLDQLDGMATDIGAVNTIKIEGGKLVGYNTDVYGFTQSILPLLEQYHMRALILGTGGSSKAVAHGLKKMGLDVQFVSRHPEFSNELSYSDLDGDTIREYKVIINCTPLGMYPSVDDSPPIPYEYLTPSHLLFDLIYNPEETVFLKRGKEKGAKTSNGLEMLRLQAEQSWKIWNANL
jgi:shikimate dehydrogenase